MSVRSTTTTAAFVQYSTLIVGIGSFAKYVPESLKGGSLLDEERSSLTDKLFVSKNGAKPGRILVEHRLVRPARCRFAQRLIIRPSQGSISVSPTCGCEARAHPR